MYAPGEPEWRIFNVRRVPAEDEATVPSCGVLTDNFYIGADGMGMCDTGFASRFPSLYETPLNEILRDAEPVRLSAATVADIRDHNPKCRECAYVDRCTGSCRNVVLTRGDDYYGVDEDVCYFFENGWEERIAKAAEGPFREYLKRNPPGERTGAWDWRPRWSKETSAPPLSRPHCPGEAGNLAVAIAKFALDDFVFARST